MHSNRYVAVPKHRWLRWDRFAAASVVLCASIPSAAAPPPSPPPAPAASSPASAPPPPSDDSEDAPVAPAPEPWIYEPPPPAPRFAAPPRFELGVGLRGDGGVIDRRGRRGPSLALGGVGASVRPRWHDRFALDLAFDFITGTDYNGFERSEDVVSLQPMFFFGRRGRARGYLTGGLHLSRATVDRGFDQVVYHYAGGDFGAGVEIRTSFHTAIDLDGLLFIRTRTDSSGPPEFVDPATGRTTDTSGGALLRITFLVYFPR